jgi:surface carbohydrate biosynthesis protein
MPLASDLPTILFSVETAARELDSKLVMAAALATRGCRVIVGHKEAVTEIANQSQRVVWQGKSLFSVHSADHLADRLAANGSEIMFISDEGAMHQADSWVQQILHKHWVDYFDKRHVGRMCVWGQRQRDVISSHSPQLSEFTSVTGSARFDLCLPRFSWVIGQTAPFPDGSYILVCTRFSALAHAKGLSAPFAIKLNRNAWPDAFGMEEITDLWFSKWRRDAHDFAEFTILIREMATSLPDRTIVIRPHPSESMEFYRHAFADKKNVQVRREGNVLNWIRAAALVVHSGSTSGVEAVLAGRPVLNYLPEGDGRRDTDIEVAREAGVVAGSLSEALENLDRLLAGKAPAPVWSADAKRTLNNLQAEAIPLLVDETLSVLQTARIEASTVTLPRGRSLKGVMKRFVWRGGADSYVVSKRGRLTSGYVEQLLEGCLAHNVGNGRLRHLTEQYAVIEPV